MTETELDQLKVRLTGDGSDYARMLQQAERATTDASRQIESASRKIEGFNNTIKGFASGILSYAGALGIVTSLHGAFEQFKEVEKSQVRLRALTEANGRSAREATRDYLRFAQAMAQTTTATKGQVLGMAQQAEAMGITGENAKKAIEDATSLAALKGGEASEWMRVAIAVQQGNTQMAAHMLHLHNITDKTKLLAEYQKLVERGHKVETEMLGTVDERLKKVAASFKGLSKDIGAMVGEAALPMIEKLKEIADWFQSLDATTRKYLVTVTLTAAAVAPLVGIYAKVSSRISAIAGGLDKLSKTAEAAGGWFNLAKNSWGLWIAGLAAGTFVIYEVSKAIYNANQAVKDWNAELERTKGIQQAVSARTQKDTDKIVNDTKAQTGFARQDAATQQLALGQKELAGAEMNLKAMEATVKALDTYWNNFTGNKLLEQARMELKAQQTMVDDLKDRVGKLREVADNALGIDPKKLDDFKLAMKKLDVELTTQIGRAGKSDFDKQFGKDVYAPANALTAQPMAVYQETLAKLRQQLQEGTIDYLEFDQANAKAIGNLQNTIQPILDEVAAREKQLAMLKAVTEASKTQASLEKYIADTNVAIKTFGLEGEAKKIAEYDLQIKELEKSFKAGLIPIEKYQELVRKLTTAKFLAGDLKALEDNKKAWENWQKTVVQRGQDIAKQVATPLENLAQQLDELDNLLIQGAITYETYSRALDKAGKDYDAATGKANQFKDSIKVDAVMAGTAAALAEIADYQSRISLANNPNSAIHGAIEANKLTPEQAKQIGDQEAAGKQIPILFDIKEILKRIAENKESFPDNPNIQYPDADLNGNLGVGD